MCVTHPKFDGHCGRTTEKRRISFAEVVIGAIGLLASAACSDVSPAPRPRLHVPASNFEMGEVPVSEDAIEAVFQIENHGDAPLEIYRAESAGCLCVDARALDAQVSPGKSGRVIVRVRPATPGEKSTRAIVTTNDPTQGFVELNVRWHAVQAYEWKPAQLNLGRVRPTEIIERKVQLIRRVPAPSAMHKGSVGAATGEVVSGDAMLSVHHVDTAADHLDGEYTVAVTLLAGRERGAGEGRIQIEDPLDTSRSCSLPVRWEIGDVVRTVPARIYFGAAPGGATVEREILIVADSHSALEALSATFVPTDADISFTQQQTSDRVIHGKVVWRLPRREGIYRASLQLACGHPDGCAIDVPMSVAVAEVSSPTKQGETR